MRGAKRGKEESAADYRCEARRGTGKEEKGAGKGGESSKDVEVGQQVSHLRRNVVEMDEGEVDLHWYPSAFVAEHMSMEVRRDGIQGKGGLRRTWCSLWKRGRS